MIILDKHEEVALNEFLKILDEQRFDSQPTVRQEQIRRSENGQIIVHVDVTGSDPSVSLSLFMQHKADQLYQHTACRFVLG